MPIVKADAGMGDFPTRGICRLDVLLVRRGLASTRTKAQRLIREGAVRVDGGVVAKASAAVDAVAAISVDRGDDYVSRGAYKLLGALEAFADDGLPGIRGMHALDIGASTGGFSDVLLRHGVAHIVALDVGHGQLDARIACDSRVTSIEGANIRDLDVRDLPYRPDLVVCDVSFISLRYVMPVVARVALPGAHAILLVKPQFEVGRSGLGRRGIVVDDALRATAVRDVTAAAESCGMRVSRVVDSPLPGTHGNAEYLMHAQVRA